MQGGRAAVEAVVDNSDYIQFTGSERTRMMAFIGMTMGVCPPLATLVGGQLHVRFGWQANFVLTHVDCIANAG